MDTREEAHFKEETLMEEEETGRYLEGRRDMEAVEGRDMMDIVLGIVIMILPGGDQTPEADRSLEEEMDFGEIDHGHQARLRNFCGALDADVMLVSR